MPEYQKSREADADLKDIYHYTLRKWGREQARKYLARLEQCFRILAENPTLGKARPEVRKATAALLKEATSFFTKRWITRY
jgi:toxin ParE1/3/4